MSYEEFKSEYKKLVSSMHSYSCEQAGSIVYAEKIGALVDSVPAEWEEKADLDLGYDI